MVGESFIKDPEQRDRLRAIRQEEEADFFWQRVSNIEKLSKHSEFLAFDLIRARDYATGPKKVIYIAHSSSKGVVSISADETITPIMK